MLVDSAIRRMGAVFFEWLAACRKPTGRERATRQYGWDIRSDPTAYTIRKRIDFVVRRATTAVLAAQCIPSAEWYAYVSAAICRERSEHAVEKSVSERAGILGTALSAALPHSRH